MNGSIHPFSLGAFYTRETCWNNVIHFGVRFSRFTKAKYYYNNN